MNLDTKVGDVEIKLDTSRIDDNLLEAQKLLNMQVVADSAPFVPFRQGALRNSVRSLPSRERGLKSVIA